MIGHAVILLFSLFLSSASSFGSPFASLPSLRPHLFGVDRTSLVGLRAAPPEALGDIVIPSIGTADEDPRVWVPQTDCLSFRPLCLCVSQGYYVNLLRFTGGGTLGCHRHPSPVHAYTLKGGWGYKEHGWHAAEGTYVFEPPGETHTLIVDDDCDEMVALFHVTGSLIYVDPETGDVTGYDDVFTKLEKAKAWYKDCGLGEDYVQQFIR
uniref:ChrR-like cupin domain-containing protein n=1 Tax=Trieres chinensis TaxID=1514140 RepID=A0A7S1ZZM3_TRICV|mmetsp:Transcript_36375/g.74262  ORF Transcript_36375/g.74262 Transcript_36375/m.74262 type:complete len:209 (+) Transcript_36375:128-754(+)|eukprot:CAMPEP_0183307652 /NCGR_PEP_ID=MMETSP0160_2-20130417/18574_1 /TAXON_ID=2839 ORGANISM="Odontella Sinensis, Strain Grunow 1884" /NCGR_SAMPLE_ID=MMETSP0160_2 /ASSEMBLY_ACC=CAM_ASM_000250 /LENGTH=208 /DNA_ID=CAMNT_0025471281 /DNA_START=128 /DNA_END=754 /DNA_ORIENTATION=+